MWDIRPFKRRDLPAVAALYELVMRSGRSTPAPGLVPYFERLFFDQPWADPELPGLVAVDDQDRVIAFQGSHTRRARFDGHPVRIVCVGQFVSHPDVRYRAIGRTLVRTQLAGPQELTITDTANERAQRLGVLLGSRLAQLSCVGWTRVMRPLLAARHVLPKQRSGRRAAAGTRVISAIDAAVTKSVGLLAPPPEPDTRGELLTPAVLVENLPLLGDHVRLHLDYDEAYVAWLFGELARMTGLGALTPRLVRNRNGRPLGWYVYLIQPGRSARVLQVAAADGDVGRVLDHLLHEAWSAGAARVQGRLQPSLLVAVGQRRCLLRYHGGALLHSEHEEILAAVATGDSLLTRMDGEWWAKDQMVDLRGC